MRAGKLNADRREEHLVVVTDAPQVAGAERALGQLISHLDASVKVTVASVDAEVGRWVASHRPSANLISIPPLVNKRDLLNLANVRGLLQCLAPTVLHLNKTEVGGLRYVEVLGRSLRGVRVVSVVHHVERPGSWVSNTMSRFIARRAPAIVAVGSSLARQLETILHLPEGRVVTITNSLDSKSPGLPTTGAAATSRTFTVGALTRLVAHKRVGDLVDAMAQLTDVRLILAGDGPEMKALQTKVQSLGLTDRIDFLGWVPPESVLAQIDVYMLASEIEGYPIALLEAQRASLPVIASNVGSVAEIVTDGVDGLLFEPGDISSLRNAIELLKDNPELRLKMSEAAKDAAIGRPTLTDMANAYAAVFWPLEKADHSDV